MVFFWTLQTGDGLNYVQAAFPSPHPPMLFIKMLIITLLNILVT